MDKLKDKIRQLQVLVVDANDEIQNLLKLQFSREGFKHVTAAFHAEQALDIIRESQKKEKPVHIVILDIMLPGMDGFALCRRIVAEHGLPTVILSARLDRRDEIRALEAGASDYVRKPYTFQVLLLKIERLLTQQYLSEELKTSNKRSQKLFLNILQVIIKTMEAKDPYASGHSQNVSTYASRLAEAVGFKPRDVSLMGIAGMVHDIGMIGVEENIIMKAGALSDAEFEAVKKHSFLGAVILEPIEELGEIIDTVRHHHEHFDGSGYPDGLAGGDIPLGSRILCIADAYDAMTTERPYRQEPLHRDEAAERLRGGSGTQFDPKLVEAFVADVLPALPETAS